MELQSVRETAEAIAQQAGAILMQYFDKPHQQQFKKTPIDIVTEADTASEAMIVAALREHFPDHHIVGEEGGGMGAPAGRRLLLVCRSTRRGPAIMPATSRFSR